MKIPAGSVKKKNGRWRARISWTDEYGRRRERTEYVDSKNEGLDQVNAWRKEWKEKGIVTPAGKQIPKAHHTFGDLLKYYRENYAIEPEYREGRKIAGLQSWRTVRGHLVHLEPLKRLSIELVSWESVRSLKAKLLSGKTWKGDVRSAAYTNRVLSTLRRVLKVGRQIKWMTHNPFAEGDTLIQRSHETERTRTLTSGEEVALLEAATTEKRRPFMRPLLITAIETGLRDAELVALTWDRIKWDARTIEVAAFIEDTQEHTKTMESRIVPMSLRLLEELLAWKRRAAPGARVFGLERHPRSGWDSVRKTAIAKLASLDDLKFHDLRHTAATRWIAAGVALADVSRMLGHKDIKTTMRYVNMNKETAQAVGRKIDRKARLTAPRKRKEPTVSAEVM